MKNLRLVNKHINTILLEIKRNASKLTNAEVIQHRANLFNQEQRRQLDQIKRIEKIEVNHVGQPEDCKLIMNKGVSTPYNCAMHISELLVNRSVLALVNGVPWDMHRPLEADCELKFLHFKDENPTEVNRAYWRSSSLLLGYLLETSFKNDYFVDLCSFPPPNIKSGSFVYDAQLNIPNWKPTRDELRCLSISASKLFSKKLRFERLQVKEDLAKEIFKFNKFKLEQIPSIAAKSGESNAVTLYKLGDYVDMSKGPMISNTSLMGRFEIAGVHDIDTPKYGKLQRVQGLSIPSHLHLHFWTFQLLAQRAAKINTSDSSFNVNLLKSQSQENATTQNAASA